MPNHLKQETSPYLLQHADNPVDWYPWNEEALQRAKSEDKPILLSIGYSACHWCHVMAHESFQNVATAKLMNDNFINIKVDREERPDLDNIYMQAVQSITGRGGWPLTVFLTPEGKPFFGGTYFPPENKQGMPGFPRVLQTVADAYQNRRGEVENAVQQIINAMTAESARPEQEPLVPDILEQAYLVLSNSFDKVNGGFGTAPKFPQPMTLEFLLRYYHRTQDEKALAIVNESLQKMAKGGIYDQLGGGFHRYATDSNWLVPHFEKMLYDNALLSQVYLSAYLITSNRAFRSVVEETIDYIIREMISPQGAFYGTQDADSEGVEGKYYLWTRREIAETLGEETGRLVADYYGVTAEGNFDGSNILHINQALTSDTADLIQKARASLFAKRSDRVKPGIDKKSLASWNGLMLKTIAEAAGTLNRPDYLDAAIANGSFLLETMIKEGFLQHTYKDGEAKINGYLDDYAMVTDGFLSLYYTTFQNKWLQNAITLAQRMVAQFWDETAGTFYDTGSRHDDLFIRPQSTFDGALPSGSSMAAMVLMKLSRLTDDQDLAQIAVKSLQSVWELMSQYPLGYSNWLCTLDLYLSEPQQIVIVGPRNSKATSELLNVLYTTWLPNKVLAVADPAESMPLPEVKLLENRIMINNQPTAYVCHHFTCHQPVTDPVSFADQLRGN